MHATRLIPIVVLALASPTADATDHVVGQKGRMFSVAEITVARGEPVIFVNDDTVPHNAMSKTPDNAFDLGSQMPGTATPVTFDKAGIVAVICAIHPRMRLTIKVTD